MGASPDSPPKNPKPDVVMGYPSAQDDNKYPAAPPPPPAPPSKAGSCEAQLPQAPPPYQQQYPNPYNQPHASPYNLYATSSPYQPYPPPPPYQHDPNYMSQPPYNDYYYHHHEPTASASFGRVLLILLLMLLFSFLMMSLIMWIIFGASVPEFEVGSVKVSNFSAANATAVAGAWAVQLWVSNVNMELNVRFDHGMCSVFYKDSMIGVAALDPFDVRKTQRFGLNFTVPALPDQKWVPPALAEDRATGVVVVSLRLAVDANFTGTDSVYRHERLRILCDDLPIKFASPATGEGTLSTTFGNHCYIRLREGRD